MQSIVITGVSSGIGYATARLALKNGARVFGTVRARHDVERLADAFGSAFVPLLLDVRDEAAVVAAARQVRADLDGQTLSGLVNNAGVAIPGPLLHQPLSDIREQIETDLMAVFTVTQAFGPLLGTDRSLQGPPGRIVMMSSIAGEIGQPFLSAYAASKHGLEGLADALRRELMIFGIDVVTIGPAPVDTPIWDKAEPLLGRYDGTEYGKPFDRAVRLMTEIGHRHSLAATQVAEDVWTALTAHHPRPRYAPAQHKVLEQWFAPALPRRWLDRIVGLGLGLRRR
jgi:NAD(P)-dependent dehydrogenase (short-subunit alcohol dehydrogenase family)